MTRYTAVGRTTATPVSSQLVSIPSTANGRDPLFNHRREPPDLVRGAAVGPTAARHNIRAAILITHLSIRVQRASHLPSVIRDLVHGFYAPSKACKGVPTEGQLSVGVAAQA